MEIPGDRVYVQVPAHGKWRQENCSIASLGYKMSSKVLSYLKQHAHAQKKMHYIIHSN